MPIPNSFRVIKAYWLKLAYDFSSVQFDFPQDLATEIILWGKRNIPDSILKASEGDPKGFTGRENEIHLTIKYGLHTVDPDLIKPVLKNQKPFKITLGEIDAFEKDDEDVIKINVLPTPELMALNKLISKSFEVTDTYPEYKPHVTNAYVRKGEGKKYKGIREFYGREVQVDSLLFSGRDNRKTPIPLFITKKKNPPVIAVDFDGTLVEPNDDVMNSSFILKPHAKEVLDWMYNSGYYLILWTVRDGEVLLNALNFLKANGIRFHSVNQNAPFLDFPTSRKIYFDFCIDDRGFESEINWLLIKELLKKTQPA
jgi:hypothetical protein